MKKTKWGWKKSTALIAIFLVLIIIAFYETAVIRKHIYDRNHTNPTIPEPTLPRHLSN